MSKYAIEGRTARVNRIKIALKTAKKVELRKFIAQSSLDLGCSIDKIKEYVSLLEEAEYIKIKDGVMEWVEK